jgi:hypothetical protein
MCRFGLMSNYARNTLNTLKIRAGIGTFTRQVIEIGDYLRALRV